MATSGSFDTSHRISGNYNTYATFSWQQTGQSIDGNYTDISWSLTGKTASQYQNIYVYGVSVTVNGSTTSKNFNGSMYNGTVLMTGTTRIYHNNDGTKSFSASASFAQYSSGSNYSGSGSWALNSIPRKATIKSAPNFNDEENPTITYENKAGNSVSSLQACISLTGSADDIAYRDISKTGTSYTFNLTEAERNVLRNATTTSNSRTVKFFVKTVIGSNTFSDFVDKTFSIVNANPVFSDYTFHDGNSTTTAITGNNQWIIQNKSSLVVDIASANKATAQKNATMESYVYEISSYSGSETYTTSDLSKTIGAIDASQNQNLKVTAIDSRRNSTAVSKTVNIVPYATPVLNVSATRQNNFEANTTIKVSGSASPLKVNNVVKNTVNATNGVQYRKKQSSTTTWGSWTNISSSYNTSTGAVIVPDFVISLDNQQAWDLEFKLTDKLETKTVAISVSQGQPQFFIGADGRLSVGGLPTVALPSGNTGQLEVYGDVYAKNLRSTGNAYANGNRLAELPITAGNIDFATLGARYETTINGYIPLGDTSLKNIGYFTASPNRLYILRFGGGPWVGKATGIWRARTGSYSGSVFSSSVMIAPDASGIYESSTSPIFFIQGSTSSNIYLTFQPYQSAEWSFKCDVYSIEARTS